MFKIYQENKERLKKKKRYKSLSEGEKEKLVEHRKNIIEWEKTLYYNYKKVFQFRKFCFFIRKTIKNFWSWKVTPQNIKSFLKYKKVPFPEI